jgi:hypothetical protein
MSDGRFAVLGGWNPAVDILSSCETLKPAMPRLLDGDARRDRIHVSTIYFFQFTETFSCLTGIHPHTHASGNRIPVSSTGARCP